MEVQVKGVAWQMSLLNHILGRERQRKGWERDKHKVVKYMAKYLR